MTDKAAPKKVIEAAVYCAEGHPIWGGNFATALADCAHMDCKYCDEPDDRADRYIIKYKQPAMPPTDDEVAEYRRWLGLELGRNSRGKPALWSTLDEPHKQYWRDVYPAHKAALAKVERTHPCFLCAAPVDLDGDRDHIHGEAVCPVECGNTRWIRLRRWWRRTVNKCS